MAGSEVQALGGDDVPDPFEPLFASLSETEEREVLGALEQLQEESGPRGVEWAGGNAWCSLYRRLGEQLPRTFLAGDSPSAEAEPEPDPSSSPVHTVVDVLSEAILRSPEKVGRAVVEEMVWVPFVAFHRTNSNPAAWEPFASSFAKLVQRHGTVLFGKASSGELLRATCQWLLHEAIFNEHEALRDRALIGLLLLLADSYRQHGTVAAMTMFLTMALAELLRKPAAPKMGLSLKEPSPTAFSGGDIPGKFPTIPPPPPLSHTADSKSDSSLPPTSPRKSFLFAASPTRAGFFSEETHPAGAGGSSYNWRKVTGKLKIVVSEPALAERDATGHNERAGEGGSGGGGNEHGHFRTSGSGGEERHGGGVEPGGGEGHRGQHGGRAGYYSGEFVKGGELRHQRSLSADGLVSLGVASGGSGSHQGVPSHAGGGGGGGGGGGEGQTRPPKMPPGSPIRGSQPGSQSATANGQEGGHSRAESSHGSSSIPSSPQKSHHSASDESMGSRPIRWDHVARARLRALLKMMSSTSYSQTLLQDYGLGVGLLEEMAGRWRWEEVKGMCAIIKYYLVTWNDYLIAKSSHGNPHALAESHLAASNASAHVPDLRLQWLEHLSILHQDAHPERSSEAAMCRLAAAGIILQYLLGLQGESANSGFSKTHLQALKAICPDMPAVSSGLLRVAADQSLTVGERATGEGARESAGAGEGQLAPGLRSAGSGPSGHLPLMGQSESNQVESCEGAGVARGGSLSGDSQSDLHRSGMKASPGSVPESPSSSEWEYIQMTRDVPRRDVPSPVGTSRLQVSSSLLERQNSMELPDLAPANGVVLERRPSGDFRRKVGARHERQTSHALLSALGFRGSPGTYRDGAFVLGRTMGYLDVREEVAAEHLLVAGELFATAEMFNIAEQVLGILVDHYRQRHNTKGLLRCHLSYQKLYTAMAARQEGPLDAATSAEPAFFLIGFHGERFGSHLHRKEFVYRERRVSTAASLADKLKKAFERRLGGASRLRFIVDASLPEDEALVEGSACVQVVTLRPIPSLDPAAGANGGLPSIQASPFASLGPFREFTFTHDLPDLTSPGMIAPVISSHKRDSHQTSGGWKQKTMICTRSWFPSLLARQPITNTETLIQSPVEFAIDEVEIWLDQLRFELEWQWRNESGPRLMILARLVHGSLEAMGKLNIVEMLGLALVDRRSYGGDSSSQCRPPTSAPPSRPSSFKKPTLLIPPPRAESLSGGPESVDDMTPMHARELRRARWGGRSSLDLDSSVAALSPRDLESPSSQTLEPVTAWLEDVSETVQPADWHLPSSRFLKPRKKYMIDGNSEGDGCQGGQEADLPGDQLVGALREYVELSTRALKVHEQEASKTGGRRYPELGKKLSKLSLEVERVRSMFF